MFDHSHHHQYHPPRDYSRAFRLGVLLNLSFVALEVVFGLYANSLALLADAGHNLSDVLGLLIAWGAVALAKRKPSERYTYGLQSSSIIAALLNAALLLVAVGGIGLESIQRFLNPAPVVGSTMIWVALLGVLINSATAMLFFKGHDDLNIRSAFLHMKADALISLGVAISGTLILFTGWLWVDPAVSFTIAAVIAIGTWGLLRDSVNLALQAVPRNIDINQVRDYLAALPGVSGVHDLHVWAMSTSETALSAHLLVPAGHPGDEFIWNVVNTLSERFGISHATLQMEMGNFDRECSLTTAEVHRPAQAHSHGAGCNHEHSHNH